MLNFRTSAIIIHVDLLFMERIKGWPRPQKGHKDVSKEALVLQGKWKPKGRPRKGIVRPFLSESLSDKQDNGAVQDDRPAGR